ncbi:MAG: hypothetical protein ACR2JX_07835 [Mycobacteriales bacterium]
MSSQELDCLARQFTNHQLVRGEIGELLDWDMKLVQTHQSRESAMREEGVDDKEARAIVGER